MSYWAGSRPNRLFWLPTAAAPPTLPPAKADQQHFPDGEVFYPFGEVLQHVPQHRYHHYVPSPCGFVSSSSNKSNNVRGAVWHVPTPDFPGGQKPKVRALGWNAGRSNSIWLPGCLPPSTDRHPNAGRAAAGLPPNSGGAGTAAASADSSHRPHYTVAANLAASGKLFGRFQQPDGKQKRLDTRKLTSMAGTASTMSTVPAVAYPAATGPYHCYFVYTAVPAAPVPPSSLVSLLLPHQRPRHSLDTISRGYANRGGGISGGEAGRFHQMGLRYVLY